MKRQLILIVIGTLFTTTLAVAQSDRALQAREAAAARLQAATGGAALISNHKSIATARFVRIKPGTAASLGRGRANTNAQKQEQSQAFFREYSDLVGTTEPASMRLGATVTDRLGETHLTWRQYYNGLPVFGTAIKTHFDRSQQLKAVSGTAIPYIDLDTSPNRTRENAAAIARESVAKERGNSDLLRIGSTTLLVFREGLAKGVPGENHLAWEVEVTDGANIRDFVYVDAHNGKVIDRITAIHEALNRRAYDGHNLPFVPENYPSGTYWTEGENFPTNSTEANNMILASKETYNFFSNGFGRDSFDGDGATMDAIFNRGYGCPNASWNGTFISFCPGFTADDVTAHEWGHAYTQYTHGLIYQWQSGALNESYSDIWGEVVDRINGRGTDTPGPARTAACSTFSPPVGTLRVNSPAGITGDYFAQSAAFGPALTQQGVTGDVVAALDPADAGGPSTFDACSPLTNAASVSGKIALVDRGTCVFVQKVLNAQAAGAIGVIVANNAATGLPGMGAAAGSENVTIPSLGVQQATGTNIRTQLTASATVNSTLLARPGTDASVRWLMGEDVTGSGALRDMWNPTCYSNPAKVTDTAYYVCSTADQGGVHTNSGVPNHGFALLVDGGTFNGHAISPIGLTKAAHIYFRASSVYQVFDTDFADHADALEASCSDLTGQPLTELTGGPSAEVINSSDCSQVTEMIAAVELRTSPTFCNFATLLDSRTAPTCSPSTTTGVTEAITSFTFEAGADGWNATHEGVAPEFTSRDWTLVSDLPSGKAGSGFFAPDPNIGTCDPGGDESGVLHLTSPEVEIPTTASFARATFEHWVATEPTIDGGNLKVSVNGGPWQLVPPSEFSFNNYTGVLVSAADGNTNPLAGQPAWSGTNPGTITGGSWGRTHVNLGAFAKPGDSVRLRWDLGTDGCAGRGGWYLDNVNVFSCVPKVPTISVADISTSEGDAGTKVAQFAVVLSTPTMVPVTVSYQFVDGTARHDTDFVGTNGVLVIPASSATSLVGGAFVTVQIKGDTAKEADEVFSLKLSNPTNATITDGEAQATIVNDDKPR